MEFLANYGSLTSITPQTSVVVRHPLVRHQKVSETFSKLFRQWISKHVVHRTRSHIFDDGLTEFRTLEESCIIHQSLKVIGHRLGANGALHALNDEICCFVQPMCRSIISALRIKLPGLTLSCPVYLGAVPWVASKIAIPVS